MTSRNKRINMLLAVVIAIAAWTYVIIKIDPLTTKTIKQVPIEFQNQYVIDNQEMAVRSLDVESIDVTVEGKRSIIAGVGVDDVRASVNLDGVGIGENTLKISLTTPSEFDVVRSSTKDVNIIIDEKSYKEVAGRPVYTDTSDMSIEPMITESRDDVYVVAGAKNLVDMVEYVEIPIVVSKVSEDSKTFSVEPIPVDADGNEVNFVEVKPQKTSVDVVAAKIKSVSLKVNVGIPDSDEYHITYSAPTSIQIKGVDSVISPITEIETEVISAEGYTESTDVPLEFILPEGVQIGNIALGTSVHLKVTPYVTKELKISTDKIKVVGLASDLTYQFSSDTVKVNVIGLKENASAVTSDDVAMIVRASDMGVGTYTASIETTTEVKAHKVEVAEPIYVTITSKS